MRKLRGVMGGVDLAEPILGILPYVVAPVNLHHQFNMRPLKFNLQQLCL